MAAYPKRPTCWVWLFRWLVLGVAAPLTVALSFTRHTYNTTISENSRSLTYVTTEEKMGIFVPDSTYDVKYKIVSGDNDRFFKAENRLVGDFCFLAIRTRTGQYDVLNRERREVYTLQVKATIKSSGQSKVNLRAKTEVRVQVLDTNDLNPIFAHRTYNVEIPEDTPLHKNIIQVSASDADLGLNGDIYYSLAELNEQFAIHPSTGEISLTRPLNYHDKHEYELKIFAQDRGPKQFGHFASTSTVHVKVRQVNLHDPLIVVRHLPSIVEDSNVDIYAIVKVVDEDEGIHGKVKRIEIINGDPDGHFRLQPGNQPQEFNIVVLNYLDREVAPFGYNLTLRVTDEGIPPRSTTKEVWVRVTDLNDHAPQFAQAEYRAQVEEVAPINTPVIRVTAQDTDVGRNAQVVYQIIAGNDDKAFVINSVTGLISTARALDAEDQLEYKLTVLALDQAHSGMRKSNTTQVYLTVLDNNDEDPMFVKSSTDVLINENEPVGQLVYRASAVDNDQGENGYVSYSIANLSPTPFTIDHFTGEIRTKEVLDYETMRHVYALKIRASDWGTAYRRQTEMTIRVMLQNINDNRPQFEKVDCNGFILRKAPINSELLTLSAIDFDDDVITYRIIAGNEDRCFELDQSTGVVSLVCSLEDVRGKERFLNFTASDGIYFSDPMAIKLTLVTNVKNLGGSGKLVNFECRDSGVTQQYKEMRRMAESNNQHSSEDRLAQLPNRFGTNRHQPEFDSRFPLRVTVNESAPVGFVVLAVKAADKDLGYNGQLVYAIAGGNVDSCLQVDLHSGLIRVISPLDREHNSQYTLNITVYDLGKPQKSAWRLLDVDVLDVNDNPPVFVKSTFSVAVAEDAASGTSIARLQATDRDVGTNAAITYTLITDTEDFAIDSKLGTVTVRRGLDRERQESYELKFRATDGASDHPLSATALIRVQVLDINDNPPHFPLPQYLVRLREDIPKGTVVAELAAHDPDLKEGGRVVYSLQNVDEKETFVIDPMYGVVRLAQNLDFETRQVYNITVTASDKGSPSLKSRVMLIVEVMDVSENRYSPKFADYVVAGSVTENMPAGTFVMQVNATDDDDGPNHINGNVLYSIRDGNGMGYFTIDIKGNIYTTAVLDRETERRYWLTVYGQDRAAVPLHSRLEVYIEVLDENDNTPQTVEPVYYPSVPENSLPGTRVVEIEAYDPDEDPDKRLTFRISSGNPQGFFAIDTDTGVITTTSRHLDREHQDEHILEVTVSDNGHPSLSSTTKVVVTVTDVNDHGPIFSEQLYRARIPEIPRQDFDTALFQVIAIDRDIGLNADIDYTIKNGKGNGRFKINAKTGVISSQKNFTAGAKYELQIQAADNGLSRHVSFTRVILEVIELPSYSMHPPIMNSINQPVRVNENEAVGHVVTVIHAEDDDHDLLWYSIVDGNEGDTFMVKRESGEVILTRPLDWELVKSYNLTFSVTDGVHSVYTKVHIVVVDFNDNWPQFSERRYSVEVSENIPPSTEILQIHASDKDEDNRLFFALHSSTNPSSIRKFHIDSVSGIISTSEVLDQEACHQHELTILVKDHGSPSHYNYTRITIIVKDHNDHQPTFLAEKFEGHVYETASIGTAILQILAVDRDKGKNAEVEFSIVAGNVGGIFSIDRTLGMITVAKELKLKSMVEHEYLLTVKAMDHGSPPLSNTVTARIVITMANNAPPKFEKAAYSIEINENLSEGAFILNVHAWSKSTVYYEIVSGNENDHFIINPNSGIIYVKKSIDFETISFFNLTIQGTNLVQKFATCTVLVYVMDVNDNVPYFLQKSYTGNVSEAAAVGSTVMVNNLYPLVITAKDADSELNAILVYKIIDKFPQTFFSIDINTGAIHTIASLDHETMDKFEFRVQVSDMGKPQLKADVAALVTIYVEDVNDCAPIFEQAEYNSTVFLPTFRNVIVTTVKATDADIHVPTLLKYSILNGNVDNKFAIDDETGVITMKNEKELAKKYVLTVRVTDGKFSTIAKVNVHVDSTVRSGLLFSEEKYYANIMENKSEVMTVTVVTVLGNRLDEHLQFQILNPHSMFTIGKTSGVIQTNGKAFDRELQDTYTLIVEACSELDKYRVAQVVVYVNVLDDNDNAPIFINLPYYAVVPVDTREGETILKVQAIDKDIGNNGEVRYELSDGNKEYFRLNGKTGDLSLKKPIQEINKEFKLLVTAYDRGMQPQHTETTAVVRVISRSVPFFNQHYYSALVPENIQAYSPVLSVHAESPEGRKLIYSIIEGNENEEFTVDFNTEPDRSNGPCVVHVVDELDYEVKQSYELTLQATDSVSGSHSEVYVVISIEDVNDNLPEFSKPAYHINVLETLPVGAEILQLATNDKDSGPNKIVQYSLFASNGNTSDYFQIHPSTGMITLKGSLDRERMSSHRLMVIASDSGVPALSSSAQVWVTVLDVNDNPPRFEHPAYNCFLSELATRGQFVTMVTASDADSTDQSKLIYTIVGGNDQQCFSINSTTGIITLISLHKFNLQSAYSLNVSVSDGVYTNFARVKIDILSANRYAPHFERSRYEAHFQENMPIGSSVTTLVAFDDDRGDYGRVMYTIQSDISKQWFSINSDTGEIFSKKVLDREQQPILEVPIVAVDGGGQSGHALLRVIVADVNDNPPQFKLGEYQANIHATTNVGTTILQVQAIDEDSGASSTVEYSIYETNASDANTTDLFSINKENGQIFLKKSATAYENQVYQFFVRAKDHGIPALESDVPVEIFIMGKNDIPPKFSQRSSQYFIHENVPFGTVITILNAQSNESVKYSIASQMERSSETDAFRIDEESQLVVAGLLDREIIDMYTLTIRAETESTPPLTDFTDITIQIMDENDNDPEFESNPYRISVAENVAEGSTVLKVVAHDRDLGHNADLSYSLGADSENLANIFAIDSAIGWVTVMVPLDRELTAQYSLSIIATDNGNPVRSGKTVVHIEVQDYNDNPPQFTQDEFKAAVYEDEVPGTVIVTVSTTDADSDLNSRIEYYITRGNEHGHFQIQHTGEIILLKVLDREQTASYKLEVTATDGTYTTETFVYIEILDANDNPPVCKQVKYVERIMENAHVGSAVLTLEVSDKDEPHNARFKYLLTGTESEDFTLDHSGHLRIAKPLDRETHPRYKLTAHVQDYDNSEWECMVDITLNIADVNDNAPEFTQELYSVTVPEDTEIRTLIGKVHANDRDLGINRKLKYSFVDSGLGHFYLDEQSGLISLSKSLDREQQALYNLTVKATDRGSPKLSSFAHLLVIVLDINDNPPEFASRIYHASVSENVEVGSDIVRVLATSRDSGVNAEITYSIVGGNEHGKFAIHSKTGIVTVVEHLDYEKARDYFLTIQANDGGTPSLSNQANVNVTVLDSNDNAPLFGHSNYNAIVAENAKIGEKVLQVVATDLDSTSNGQIAYYIIKGDKLGQFQMNKESGVITVQSMLDRELIAKYDLDIQAVDSGVPSLSTTATVKIDIADINDSPPMFSKPNHTAFLQEDKSAGYDVLKFVISDADLPPNGAPFTFDIRDGNYGNKFRIAEDGTLRTAAKFSHKTQEIYTLQIRVFDNGTPPLYSDTWVTIQVIEESSFQPVVSPLEIVISSYMDEFPGGILGKIKASDQDPYDTLTFSLHANYQQVFEINPHDGTLSAQAGLDVGSYILNVSVSDGKFITYGMVTVEVNMVTEQMLEHAVIVRFESLTPENFIVSGRRSFEKTLRNLLSLQPNAVEIISIQPAPHSVKSKRYASQNLDVAFSIRRGQTGFFQAEQVRKALYESKPHIESALGVKILKFHENLCTSDRCFRGDCHDRLVLDERILICVTTDTQSFVSPQHYHRTECHCHEGYGGDKCDTAINECAENPCTHPTICIPDSSIKGYTCQCPEGNLGSMCKIGSIEKNPISFRGKSYARYTLVNSMDRYFALSLRIRTSQQTGCLKYAAGRVDYSILETVNGIVQYRFNCGSGEGIVRVEDTPVNDGEWHEILLNRYSNTAELIVDGKTSSQGSTPGHNDILNIDTNEVYFGAEVHPHPTISGFEDLRMGFVGCLDDIRIDRIGLPLHMSKGNSVAILRRFTNIEFQCVIPPDLGMCGTQPCFNGGTCKATDASYVCHCHNRFTGLRCEIDTNPCGSNPCLHGGVCSNLKNDYQCNCSEGLSGKRCEFGRHCNPNPCRQGGVCEEGLHGPICKCRGFQGEMCEIDIDECIHNPCMNGGRCLNTVGSFVCDCWLNATGQLCDNLSPSSSITSSSMNITIEEIIGIGATILIILTLVFIFILVRKVRAKRARQRRHEALFEMQHKDIILKNKTQDNAKRSSKLSNLEATQTLILPPRPASYTPSCRDSFTALNNFDTVRSYGSAADELENITKYNADFFQNITKNNTGAIPPNLPVSLSSNPTSDADNLHKEPWDVDHNLKESYPETKIQNDLKANKPNSNTNTHGSTKLRMSSPETNDMNHVSSGSMYTLAEEAPAVSPQAHGKGYHWDCSDWAPSQNPLPNITEVPTNEVPDTPSVHSNESNGHFGNGSPLLDIDSEYVGDSEFNENEFELDEPKPMSFDQLLTLNNIDFADDGDSYSLSQRNYQLHPNQYLPTYSIATDTENEENGNLLQIEDDPPSCEVKVNELTPLNLDNLSLSMGGYASTTASCSDLSENLCEIEDSEICSELESEEKRSSRSYPTISTRV